MNISYKVLNLMTGQYHEAEDEASMLKMMAEFAWQFYHQQSQGGAIVRVLRDDCGHEVWQREDRNSFTGWGTAMMHDPEQQILMPMELITRAQRSKPTLLPTTVL